jgi:hypothetical protein
LAVAVLTLTKRTVVDPEKADKVKKALPEYDEDKTYDEVTKKIKDGDVSNCVYVEVEKYILNARALAHNRTLRIGQTAPKALSFGDTRSESREQPDDDDVPVDDDVPEMESELVTNDQDDTDHRGGEEELVNVVTEVTERELGLGQF